MPANISRFLRAITTPDTNTINVVKLGS
jgi:hypothetical protein